MKQGKKHTYNYSQEITTSYGPQQVSINVYEDRGGWWVRMSVQGMQVMMQFDDFEFLATSFLEQMGYTLWSPDAKVAAWAMAHMAGYLSDTDDLKWNK